MSSPITLVAFGGLEVRDADRQLLAVGPKRLALLVYLALARPRGSHQRDALLALLYPEKDTAHARMALRQLLREIRMGVGHDVVQSGSRETVALNRDLVACDVSAFESALTCGEFERAIECYAGPFLAGFHLSGCPEFEEWVEAERARLHRLHAGALEQVAVASMQRGDPSTAASWWRQLLVHEPYASRVTLGLMGALAEIGDRAAALQAAQDHASRLHSEFGAEPSREVEALAHRLTAEPSRRQRRTRAVAGRLGVALAGRYRIESLLGIGGMALVFRAQDLKHQRPVALKVLRPELAAAVGPDRFIQEIAIAARFNHPNILAVHDSGEADDLLYYVMPFVEGESLRELLAREGALPVADAVDIARQVAAALSYAHDAGVVHRDIKPENILISRGHALVADFGVARAVHVAEDGVSTSHGIVVGTPEYMSPEQASGREVVDGRSDVYALGCVLYEMLGGTPPYTGTTPQHVMASQVGAPVPSVRRINRAVSAELDHALARALAKRPEDRYDTANGLAEVLAAAAADGTAPPRAPQRAWRLPPSVESRFTGCSGRLAGGAATIFVVCVAAWALWPRVPARALDPDLLAVLPFAAVGGDSAVQDLATDMPVLFWMKLTGDYGVRAADYGTVLRLWEEAGGLGDHPVAEAEARRIARTVGAGRLVAGVLSGNGGQLELTAVLRDAGNGRSLHETTIRHPANDPVAAIDRLIVELLVSEVGGETLARLPELASHPPQAVKAYLAAERIPVGTSLDSAHALYEQAYRMDTTFALAAMQRYNRGEKDSAWARKAWDLRDRLSERDRVALRAIAGDRFGEVRTMAHKIALWDSLARRYPDAVSHWRNISNWTMWVSGAFGLPDWRSTVREASDRVLALDSTYRLSAVERFSIAVVDADTAMARRLLPIVEGAEPDPRARWMLGVLTGDSQAVTEARSAFSQYPGNLFLIPRSAVVMGKGLGDAERAAQILAETGRDPTASGRQYDWASQAYHRGRYADWVRRREVYYDSNFTPLVASVLRVIDALYAGGGRDSQMGEAVGLLAAVAAGTGSRPPETWQQGVAHCWLAQWRLGNGDTTGVQEALRHMRTEVPHPDGYAPCRALLEALLARSQGGDLREAALRLDSIVKPYPTYFKNFGDSRDGLIDYDSPVNVILAQLLRDAGEYEAGLAAARRRNESPYYVTRLLVNHLREEGRLAAMVGDTAGAIRAYEHYLALRSDPDPPWRAQWASVKAELAALVTR